MKLYTLYTASHEPFKDEWFLSSFKDKMPIHVEKCDIQGEGSYKEKDWMRVICQKADLILRAIEENQGDIFIFADVDIQFFRKIEDEVLKHLHNNDMVIQCDAPHGMFCTGFFALRANDKTLRMWKDVKHLVETSALDDQDAFNRVWERESKGLLSWIWRQLEKLRQRNELRQIISALTKRIKPRFRNTYGIKLKMLPPTFFSGGTLTGYPGFLWTPGKALPIPKEIMIHHANWTVGVANKIAQLQYVQDEVNSST